MIFEKQKGIPKFECMEYHVQYDKNKRLCCPNSDYQ